MAIKRINKENKKENSNGLKAVKEVSESVVSEKNIVLEEKQHVQGQSVVTNKILGLDTTKKIKKKTTTSKKVISTSKSFLTDKAIAETVKEVGVEFLTSVISQKLKAEHGFVSSDISGQLYAKVQAGYLNNRKPTEEEVAYTGKGVRVWTTTPKFWFRYEENIAIVEAENNDLTE